jgi:hypothetical protein
MIPIPLFFKDGIQFSSGYERVVHGGRGAYVELTLEEILVKLKSHFGTPIPDKIYPVPFYYHWLEPIDRIEKVYWQANTVNYADYKIGFYYISPSLLLPFKEINTNTKMLF